MVLSTCHLFSSAMSGVHELSNIHPSDEIKLHFPGGIEIKKSLPEVKLV